MFNRMLTRLRELKDHEDCEFTSNSNSDGLKIEKYSFKKLLTDDKQATFVVEQKDNRFQISIEVICQDGVPIWIPMDELTLNSCLEKLDDLK